MNPRVELAVERGRRCFQFEFRGLRVCLLNFALMLMMMGLPRVTQADPRGSPSSSGSRAVSARPKGGAALHAPRRLLWPPSSAIVIVPFGGPAFLSGMRGESFGVGFRVGGRLGYQVRSSDLFAFTMECLLAHARWAYAADAIFLGDPVSGGFWATDVAFGLRASVYTRLMEFWLAGHLGLGWAGRRMATYPLLDGRSWGVAWNLEGGLAYVVNRRFSVGVHLGGTGYLVGDIANTDVSPLGIAMGLDLKVMLRR